MSRKETMEAEIDCAETAFEELIQNKTSYDVFLFSEGIDDINYYTSKVSVFLRGRNQVYISCGNKNEVIKLFEMIKPERINTNGKKLLYFIDRDYEKNPSYNPNIYVTSKYAIENYYVSDNVIRQILRGFYKIKENEEFERAFNYLRQKRDDYVQHMIFPSAYYSLQINKRTFEHMPDLTKLKDYKNIKDLQTKEELIALVENAFDVTDSELANEKNYLETDPLSLLRGKYFEQTLSKDFNDLITWCNEPNKSNGIISKKHKISATIGKDSFIVIFANYSETPSCLYNYLKSKLGD